MYGLTRATLTLIGAAAAGALLWLATTALPANVSDASLGGYWAAFGLVALGGLVMALSQLLGGWTKWGWPRVSSHVFLVGVPADARRRRLDAGRARAGELLARAARSQLVGRHRDRRPGRRARVDALRRSRSGSGSSSGSRSTRPARASRASSSPSRPPARSHVRPGRRRQRTTGGGPARSSRGGGRSRGAARRPSRPSRCRNS